MKLQDVATIRTGVVTSRKKLTNFENSENKYVLLTLRCVSPLGYLDLQYAEEFYASEELKMEYLTQRNDILIRLSAPYTAILITKDEWCGCLVPSHFAIIRCNEDRVLPEYLLWHCSVKRAVRSHVRNVVPASRRCPITSLTLSK